jgi:hypothetical protein
MTPKEKANQLVDRMYNVDFHDDAREIAMRYPHAIKCALIAVDEMLIVAMKYHNKMTWEQRKSIEQGVQYYMQVKQEIEKL